MHLHTFRGHCRALSRNPCFRPHARSTVNQKPHGCRIKHLLSRTRAATHSADSDGEEFDGLKFGIDDTQEDTESSSKSRQHQDSGETVFVSNFLGQKPPPGWVKCFFPTSSVDATKSLEEYWERSDSPGEDDERAVRQDIWTLTDQPGIDMFAFGVSSWSCLKRVYVILFGVGERETEGIYSLRAFKDDGLPQETLIAFEAEEDAQRYAALLEATMEHLPNVCSIPARELLDFCADQGYNCRLEPTGSLLIPPDYNVNVTDWERALRLREGCWAVLDEEPERSSTAHLMRSGGASTSSAGRVTQVANLTAKPGLNSSALARYTGFSDADLVNIKAKLEKLLP